MSKAKAGQPSPVATTARAASRVQAAVAHQHGGVVPKGSYAGRLQAAADANTGKSGAKK